MKGKSMVQSKTLPKSIEIAKRIEHDTKATQDDEPCSTSSLWVAESGWRLLWRLSLALLVCVEIHVVFGSSQVRCGRGFVGQCGQLVAPFEPYL